MIDYAQKCKIPLEKINQSDKSSGPSKNTEMLRIDSHIIQEKSENSFIQDALGDPKKLNLVFRASEHGFKALAFHEKCDNLPNTLTIIKTEFNRRIAGYTPLTWNSTQGIAEDSSGSSFLLSLDTRQIFELVIPEKAIQCIPNYGPVFGGGSDLAICNDCNITNDSCTNFAYSYNC